MKLVLRLLLCAVFLVPSALFAKHHHHQQESDVSGNFDFYVLALSWAPTYCHDHSSDQSSECRVGAHKGFVLHGLWPQGESGAPPMSCGGSPAASDLVDYMAQYYPSRSLVQHEWQEHGTCSGLPAKDYFHAVELAYKRVQTPSNLGNMQQGQTLDRGNLEQEFADANHAPGGAVRTSCHDGELVNVEVCMTKDLQIRECSRSVRECPASSLSLMAPN